VVPAGSPVPPVAGPEIAGGLSKLHQLAVHAPAVVDSDTEQRQYPADSGEIVRPLVCTAGHVGVEPFSGELARVEQLAMRLFPFPGSDAPLVRLPRIVVIRNQVDQSRFAVPLAPNLLR
jgi:hypothetical protein